MSFGYQVLGFGASADAGTLGVGTSLGYNRGPDDWGDMGIQAGDLAIAVQSNLGSGGSFTTPTGYTLIYAKASDSAWSYPYTEGVALYYKILDGTESSGQGNEWAVVRYGKPVTSVGVSNIANSGTKTLYYTYTASTSESVLRVGCSGGYSLTGNNRDDWQNSAGNEIASSAGPGSGAAARPAGIIVTTTQGSGTIVVSDGTFNRACVAATLTPE